MLFVCVCVCTHCKYLVLSALTAWAEEEWRGISDRSDYKKKKRKKTTDFKSLPEVLTISNRPHNCVRCDDLTNR